MGACGIEQRACHLSILMDVCVCACMHM